MARSVAILTALNDAVEVNAADVASAVASMNYGTGGLGTIVLEVSAADPDEWIQIKVKNPAFAVNAEVDNLAAAGIAWADIKGVRKVRVRKSVAGAGPVTVTLSVMAV